MTDSPTEGSTSSFSRRSFCAAGVAAVGLVALGGAGSLAFADGNQVWLRPPGAVDEAHLLARCNRCGRCIQVCPYHLVQPRPLSWDFPTVGTPELNFKEGYCDFCMKCVEVCPTGALNFDAPSATNIGVAKVIRDVCIAWDWGGCTVCADVCPVEGAITLDDYGRPHVDETLCDGCGLCEHDCPAPSLRAYDRSTVDGGIYVVSRQSQAAAEAGAISSDAFAAGRNVLNPKESSHE